ncbi:MAG: helix-turn-helix transcriptional regulator [Clostridia bacterium]|nr:helix-turn-helix transcriptional regulator [Clostridia bacterium]
MSIGDQIRDARNRKDISQERLALLIHVSRGKVSHWETGLRKPKAADIAEMEKVLQCKFEIEQEQAKSPEDQAVEAPASADDNTAEAVKSNIADVFRKKVPVWLCAAIAGGVFAVMLIIMICTVSNLNRQLSAYQVENNETQNQPIAENTLEWYQQTVRPQDGKAYVSVEIDLNPVKGVRDPDGGEHYVWLYTITFIERNGIPFEVEEIFFQDFNGTAKRGARSVDTTILLEAWGSNIIPANGQQIFTGGMPVQDVSNTGVLIKGKDADGNVMEFRGIINYSQELAE